jgi:DNA topoisomerase-3
LLTDGKTDLLKEFVSNRTRRKFSAYLVARTARLASNSKRRRQPKAPPI